MSSATTTSTSAAGASPACSKTTAMTPRTAFDRVGRYMYGAPLPEHRLVNKTLKWLVAGGGGVTHTPRAAAPAPAAWGTLTPRQSQALVGHVTAHHTTIVRNFKTMCDCLAVAIRKHSAVLLTDGSLKDAWSRERDRLVPLLACDVTLAALLRAIFPVELLPVWQQLANAGRAEESSLRRGRRRGPGEHAAAAATPAAPQQYSAEEADAAETAAMLESAFQSAATLGFDSPIAYDEAAPYAVYEQALPPAATAAAYEATSPAYEVASPASSSSLVFDSSSEEDAFGGGGGGPDFAPTTYHLVPYYEDAPAAASAEVLLRSATALYFCDAAVGIAQPTNTGDLAAHPSHAATHHQQQQHLDLCFPLLLLQH